MLFGGVKGMFPLIVDSRYPYEYNGGHIVNAINIYREDQLEEIFLNNPSKHGNKIMIIFHCEFSAERGFELIFMILLLYFSLIISLFFI